METTARFESAIQKLYVAFHNNSLNPECCKQCAVGNILDNTDAWKQLSDDHGSLKLNYVGNINQAFGKRLNGYTPFELLQIEHVFLESCGFKTPLHHNNKKPLNPTDKDILFQGLEAVIILLCKFDAISNVMNYKKLFKKSKNKIDRIASLVKIESL